MEKFIRRENLIIFKRRLAEAKTDTQRQMLLKLLADTAADRPALTGRARGRGTAGTLIRLLD